MSTIVMKRPVCRSRDRFVAAILALALPSIARAAGESACLPVLNAAAPPGGPIQLNVPINDATPIIVSLPGPDSGAVQGVTLLGAPDAAGTAVNGGSSLVIRTVSPSATLGLSSDPIAVPDPAPVGTTASLTLDPAALSGVDQFGNPCVLDPLSQVTTVVQGTVSITDVLPGGGVLPAGSLIAVVGIGFQPEAQVLIDGVALASTSWVDSSRIEVVTAADTQIDGSSVSVSNPDGTGATYVWYLRATDLGKSARPLLASTEAIFPVQTQSSALFAALTSGTFFGLALQNPQPADSIVSVELWDAGSVVASTSLALPPRTKISREISELFPGFIPSGESFLQVTATVPVQMLGLSGNEVDGSVTPVLPALASP